MSQTYLYKSATLNIPMAKKLLTMSEELAEKIKKEARRMGISQTSVINSSVSNELRRINKIRDEETIIDKLKRLERRRNGRGKR